MYKKTRTSSKADISKELESKIKKMQTQLVDKAMWEACKDMEIKVKDVLQEIMWEFFYMREPESKFYDRQGYLLDSASVKATQGHGYYKINIWFDTDALNPNNIPASNPKKLNPYMRGTGASPKGAITDSEKKELLGYYDEAYGFSKELLNWFNTKFTDEFEKDLQFRMKKHKKK